LSLGIKVHRETSIYPLLANLIDYFNSDLVTLILLAKRDPVATGFDKIQDQLTALLSKFRCSLNYMVNSPSDIISSKSNTEEIPEAVDIKTSLTESVKELHSFIESLTG
jgi:hypothetical protein